jgi:hypothetical protein
MWITPLPPLLAALGEGSHGSILNGNYAPNRLSSAWKPTVILQNDADLTSLLFGASSVYRGTTSPTGVGAVAGSRAVETIEKLWDNSENIAIRGACDHMWR